MVTLTIDPKHFEDPEQAYQYIKRHRCVAETVRELKQHLITNDYFYVVEWQRNTENVHFHLILNSSYIPFDAICDAWNKQSVHIDGNVRVFGSVRFTAKSVTTCNVASVTAANYATKYMIKYPPQGYPRWVLDAQYNIRKFSTSRGFWDGIEYDDALDNPSDYQQSDDDEGLDNNNSKRTIGQIVESCGQFCNVFYDLQRVDQNGKVQCSRKFIRRLHIDIASLYDAGIGTKSKNGREVVYKDQFELNDVLSKYREHELMRNA
ncbi:MAG: hypothetical protein IT446_08970 [Phycisphaerales bacterium]|nr:hypothetical protein [Phycisphaerales bacterium]